MKFTRNRDSQGRLIRQIGVTMTEDRQHTIISCTDGVPIVRVTTAGPHGLTGGEQRITLTGTTLYDGSGYLFTVLNDTQFDLIDEAYVSTTFGGSWELDE